MINVTELRKKRIFDITLNRTTGPVKDLEKSSKNSYVSLLLNIPREPHSSYSPFLSILNLETLENRRLRLYLSILFK
ncbi:Uncharacterized protein FWK35_00031883 [Aphis craccivora]|uniref:Uncharacterized protein n=1 Tax=Aphis craccivora TaxID=307492 RepID=A0A6G0YEY5_APHCR|nr:Uncharacterized protein FWK35_00031883 [Aphis craccivora]